MTIPPITIGEFEMTSRLFVGTGKYATYELMRDALAESGCDVVTVAVRRERMVDADGRNILDFLDPDRYTLLPNTAGCFTAEDAVLTARLARAALGTNLVKLEVIGEAIFGLVEEFALLRVPDPESLVLKVNGMICTAGWVIDPATNAVVFDPDGPCMPEHGDEVLVDYDVYCYQY